MRTQNSGLRTHNPETVIQDLGPAAQYLGPRIWDPGPETSKFTTHDIEPVTPGPAPIN